MKHCSSGGIVVTPNPTPTPAVTEPVQTEVPAAILSQIFLIHWAKDNILELVARKMVGYPDSTHH